jgi:hypothetical protein
MPDMSTHGEVDRGAVETLGRRRSTYPCAILPTGVFGDIALSSSRTSRKAASDLVRELLDIALISNERLLGTSKSPGSPGRSIVETCVFREMKGLLFDQEALAFVATSRSAPFQNDSPQRGGLLGAPRERGISRRQKLEMVKVSAGQTQGTLGLIQIDPSRLCERCATFAARPLAVRDEDLDFRRTRHKRCLPWPVVRSTKTKPNASLKGLRRAKDLVAQRGR